MRTIGELVPCRFGRNTIVPESCGSLPAGVRGLVLAVKEYEQAAIEAAMTGSVQMARKPMLLNPAIGECEPSEELLGDLISNP
jgi:6-phospho-beta-glucosidase